IVPLLIFADSLFQVYLIVFLISSISRFFYPARSAMIPTLVKKEQLLVANSLSHSTYEFSAIAGYAIGGMLVGFLGAHAVFLIDSVSYLISAAFIALIAFRPILKTAVKTGNVLGRVVEEFKAGLDYSYRERKVLFLLSLLGVAVLAFAGINILWVILIRDVMGLGVEGMGVLESVFGGGMLAGTFVVGFIGHRFRNKLLIILGFGISSVSLLMIGLVPVLAPVLVFAFIAGVFTSFVNIPTITVLQKVVPEDMLGRVFSLLGTLTDTAGIISMAAIGVLAEVFPVQDLIIWLSLALLVVTIAAFLVPIQLESDDGDLR
nr:MFS transporter [Candidatus Methanofastidiosa archaeon]